MNSFCLDTIIVSPDSGQKAKNIIVLLHGYGGDAQDISVLANYWKRFLPDTLFLCPNAPEKCSINSSGFQWFDLTKDQKNYILEQSVKAEQKIIQFLNEVKKIYDITEENICLSGFSQGCMMILNVGANAMRAILKIITPLR